MTIEHNAITQDLPATGRRNGAWTPGKHPFSYDTTRDDTIANLRMSPAERIGHLTNLIRMWHGDFRDHLSRTERAAGRIGRRER